MDPETVSIVVLTKDEAANIGECLDAVLAQLRSGDEVIVVDAASSDTTVPIAMTYVARDAERVRCHASDTVLSFGAARNLGIDMARNDIIVFVSADAVPRPGWLDALRRAMHNADIVYGKQQHAPPLTNGATVSRGLRYHHFEDDAPSLPERYASNVNAAYRRFVFDSQGFDERAAGAEDVAFAKEARFAGFRIAYAKDALVGHKDVTSWKGEWRKNAREGAAYADLRKLLGTPLGHLAWATLVGTLALAAVVWQNIIPLAVAVVVFFAPTLRRLFSPVARKYKAGPLLVGAAAAPIFDIAFVAAYLRKRVIP